MKLNQIHFSVHFNLKQNPSLTFLLSGNDKEIGFFFYFIYSLAMLISEINRNKHVFNFKRKHANNFSKHINSAVT